MFVTVRWRFTQASTNWFWRRRSRDRAQSLVIWCLGVLAPTQMLLPLWQPLCWYGNRWMQPWVNHKLSPYTPLWGNHFPSHLRYVADPQVWAGFGIKTLQLMSEGSPFLWWIKTHLPATGRDNLQFPTTPKMMPRLNLPALSLWLPRGSLSHVV